VGKFSSTVAALFPRSGFARNIAVMSSATAIGQGIAILAAPILTRLYTPEDFGALGIYASLLGILCVVASLRFEQAIPLPRSDRVASNVVILALAVGVASSVLVLVCTVALAPMISRQLNIDIDRYFVYLLPLGVLLATTYQVLYCWALRKGSYKPIAQATIVQGSGATATQLTLGAFGAGSLGLIIGQVIGQSAGISNLLRVFRNGWSGVLDGNPPRSLSRVARRYRRFPLVFTWSALLNSIGLMGPALLIASFYGASVVGWYALVQRVLGAPITLLGRSITGVYFTESARLAREEPKELASLFLRLLKKLVLIGCGTIIPIGLLSPYAFPLIFGEAWAEAGRYALILVPMIFLQFVSSPFGVTLTVLERHDLALLRELIRLLSLGSVLLFVGLRGLSAETAIISLSTAGTLTYLAHIAISWKAITARVTAKSKQ